MRLDYNSELPSGMKEYIEAYGWHFSKKMAERASSNMYKKSGSKKDFIIPYTRESLDALKERFGINIKAKGYDDVYIANMCKADFLGSSVIDEAHLILYVKDVINDVDAYDGMPFTRFYADCIGSGMPIMWEDMI